MSRRNWGYVQPYLTKLRSWINGMGRHENHEIWEFANQDLKSISELLGDKKYFLGDDISTVDCVLFGHLTQFMYINIGFPQMEFMSRECKNVISLVERIKVFILNL
ncbi:failed axon connections homolog [Eurytemora carolleeae]|uniref:failed axon connections homolog n=1 Tax=Eurytemora carolleeae TaxID=1294199 RepID=UPI000C76DF03|nr:failed axon connections homolog [Eurytemora carolleeae]|eukprot:XP_023349670.1 failed axon connections homolog [Eurytemora affinis]